MIDRDYKKTVGNLVNWIRNQVEEAGCDGVVIGLSGGIDSSVTAVLSKLAFPQNTLALIMPCESNNQDEKDAKVLAESFGIDYKKVDLSDTFNTLVDSLEVSTKASLARANIKPRLRMTTLYYYANLKNALVVGTDNRSEIKLGYFTKYGDGGIDLAPLANLVKSEVRGLARTLEIAEEIISKAPSAGLWEGQTDESELGISYQEIDKYILTGKATNRVKEIVDTLSEKNKHKLQVPAIPKF